MKGLSGNGPSDPATKNRKGDAMTAKTNLKAGTITPREENGHH
jgi:hypothetical protein